MVKEAKKNKDVAGADSPAGTAPQDAKRRPVASLRVEDCSASVWRRVHVVQGEEVAFYSISFERSYKDRDGIWKYTRSFDADDLGQIVALCEKASAAIEELRAKDSAEPQQEAA